MTSRIQQIQKQYDILLEKIARLRKAHAIEYNPALKFQFEIQIQDAEKELDELEQKIELLEKRSLYK